MLSENYKFHSAYTIILVFWYFGITTGVNAQSVDDISGQSPQQVHQQTIKQTERSSDDKVDYIEAFPEESEEQSHHIYRKVNPENPCDRGLDAYDYEKKWYDESQIYINTRFCEPALWFDNFFASNRIFEEGVAGTYVRWRNEFTYDEEEYGDFKMRLDFSVELPSVQNRLRLTFSSGQDEDLRDIAPGNGEQTANSLGLQLDIKKTTRSKFNVDIGLTPKIRFRYRYTYPIYKNVILRFTQELQREKAVNSSRSLFDYEHSFKENLVFRSSTEAILSEEYDGVDWLQAFVLYQRVNKKTSLSYETSVNGITQPWRIATNYRIGFRFRKNFHREWLFYEIAPEYTWPITLEAQRSSIEIERRSKWLIFFRLEIHFGNAQDKRYQSYL
ncbi:MAG: hypothetical protein LJE83_12975 [Gammaproteobacteria bacterium]|nr:hypothetical protein [Gammaproteobacteria bacterium]